MAEEPDHREMTKLTESRPAWPLDRMSLTIGATSLLIVEALRTSPARRSTSAWMRAIPAAPITPPKYPTAPKTASSKDGSETSCQSPTSAAIPKIRSSEHLWSVERNRARHLLVRGAADPATGADGSRSRHLTGWGRKWRRTRRLPTPPGGLRGGR